MNAPHPTPVSAIWASSLDLQTKAVLATIQAYDSGNGCTASVQTLAQVCSIGETTVKDRLRVAEENRWVTVQRRPVPGTRSLTNVVRVHVGALPANPYFAPYEAPASQVYGHAVPAPVTVLATAQPISRTEPARSHSVQPAAPAQPAAPPQVPAAVLQAFGPCAWSPADRASAAAFVELHGEDTLVRVALHVRARWAEYAEVSANLLGDGAPRLRDLTPSVVCAPTAGHFLRDAESGTVSPPPAWNREVSSLHFLRYGLRGRGQLATDAALSEHVAKSYPGMTSAAADRLLRCVREREQGVSRARAEKRSRASQARAEKAAALAVGSPEDLRDLFAALYRESGVTAPPWSRRDRASAASLLGEFGWTVTEAGARHLFAHFDAYQRSSGGRLGKAPTPSLLLAVKSQVFPDAQLGRVPACSQRSRVERSEYRQRPDVSSGLEWGVA